LVKILSWFCRNVGGELTVQPGSVEPKVSIGDAGKEETAQKNKNDQKTCVLLVIFSTL
jgi:hypothetical protein